MSVESIKKVLEQYGILDNYVEFPASSETVALAAEQIGCEPGKIAKTLSFKMGEGAIVVVAMGTSRVDNKKFKSTFSTKAKFLNPDEVVELTGCPVGGVCPFDLPENVKIYLDESLKQYDEVYPAAGAKNNAVLISLPMLEKITGGEWVDVCSC
ncbi:MAG: YbaK/EbsC family protein [Oscillospiraceae bacterium]|nr:YbaK/EbsC family protein [Oscillospiraceae bacterium]